MDKPISQFWLDKVRKGEFVPCSAIHANSCEMYALRKWHKVFTMACKFYVPIHLLPIIIFKRSKIVTEPIKVIKSFLKNIILSSLWISVYVSVFWWINCKLKNYRKSTSRLNIAVAAFFAGFAVLFEPAGRRTELALYMLPRFLESLFKFMEKRGFVNSVANGEVLVFAVTMAIIMFFYQNDDKNIKPTYLSLFKKYWGEN